MAQIREELILYDKFTNTFTKYLRYGTQAAGVTQQAKRATEEYSRSQRTAAAATDTLSGSIRNLAGTFLGMQSVRWLVNTSDQLTSINARLRLMTGSAEAAAAAQEEIYQAAMRSRGAYADMADFVSQLGTVAGNAFTGTDELIAFAEQIQKQMAISGASGASAQAALVQLTQGLASGTLRGEELNSVLEQTPMIAQTIAEYMGVTTGEMRELASEGKVTAEVVKNAMLGAAEETNAQFEQMPMTWAQVWTMFQNVAIQALDPVLDAISWLANHLEELAPILAGLAAGAVAFAAGLGIQAAATWIANGAAKAFFTTLLTNPLTYIVLIIGLVVAAIYQWVQSMGGLEIAWLTVVDALLFAWDTVKAGFFTGVYFVMDLFDQLGLKIQTVAAGIQNFLGDMKVGVLNILQGMVNGAIDIINWFMVSNVVIGDMSLLTDYTYKTDIDEQTYNHVKLARPNEETGRADVFVAEDSATIGQWGMLQLYQTVDGTMNDAQVQAQARATLSCYNRRMRTLKVSSLGVPGLRAGQMVLMKVQGLGDINLDQYVLLEKVTHTWANDDHTMEFETLGLEHV